MMPMFQKGIQTRSRSFHFMSACLAGIVSSTGNLFFYMIILSCGFSQSAIRPIARLVTSTFSETYSLNVCVTQTFDHFADSPFPVVWSDFGPVPLVGVGPLYLTQFAPPELSMVIPQKSVSKWQLIIGSVV